jgi:hypothetical protein
MIKDIIKRTRFKNFKELLNEVIEVACQESTLEETVRIITTFDGRFPLKNSHYEVLSLQEKSILFVAGSMCNGGRVTEIPVKGSFICVSVTDYGRVRLQRHESHDLLSDNIIGYYPISIQECTLIKESTENSLITITGMREIADEYMNKLTEVEITNIIEEVRYMTDCIDPILIYVEDELYTCFSKYNNLFAERSGDGRFLFEELSTISYSEWKITDKLFIFCMFMLNKAGFRGEEFNGLQLTPTTVRLFFIANAAAFANALPHEPSRDISSLSLVEQAQYLGQLKKQAAEEYHFIREVNGLNFNKQQKLLPRKEVSSSLISESLHDLFKISFGIETKDYSDLNDLFTRTFPLIALGEQGLSTAIEQIIETLVSDATRELGADIGMSRGVRNWHRFKLLLEDGNTQEIIDWPTTEYFCCVVPSITMRQRIEREILTKMQIAIAQRMDYNSWHYTPGQFKEKGRHFYFPPRMSDTAEWSNVHHAGHILANVLYSIRSPKEITIGGETFFGTIDLRFMRQSGNPFTVEELELAITHTGYVQAMHQALINYVSDHDKEVKISGFYKDWYKQQNTQIEG